MAFTKSQALKVLGPGIPTASPKLLSALLGSLGGRSSGDYCAKQLWWQVSMGQTGWPGKGAAVHCDCKLLAWSDGVEGYRTEGQGSQ